MNRSVACALHSAAAMTETFSGPSRPSRSGRWGWWLLLGLWAFATTAGLVAVWRYADRPTDPGEPAQGWPAGSDIPRGEGSATVLMFVHPECACSRASLAELERVLARAPEGATATVVFMSSPSSLRPPGEESGLQQRARQVRGVNLLVDADGRESLRFGVNSSGHVLGYDREGRLRFTGGLTPGRGHEGATRARDHLLALYRGERTGGGGDALPVYGCGLRKPPEAS